MANQTITRSILEPVTTIRVEGVSLFEASKKFRAGETIDGVKIGHVGGGFTWNLLNKIERYVPPAVLQVHKLKESSIADPILAELGNIPETMLAHLWELLKKQGKGKPGVLNVSALENFSPIRTTGGNLFTVDLARYPFDPDGWYIDAYPIEDRNQMDADDQFLSRSIIRPFGVSAVRSSLTDLFRRPV